MSVPPPELPHADNVVPIHEYVRENLAQVRREMHDALEHEKRYRQQYGQAAAEAQAALAPNGWVRITLDTLKEDVREARAEIGELKKGIGRVYLMAFGVLISTLSLLLTVVFQLATRPGG